MIDTRDGIPDVNEAQELEQKSTNQPPKLHLIGDEKHEYNPAEVQEFINTVFHTPLAENAHRLVYTAHSNRPGMPNNGGVNHLVDKILSRTTKARALYFNASSCVPDSAGVLRHKRDLFSAFYVLVLDDIGTKIPVDKLPKALRDNPTYIIESSAGNFQYGYVLDEPITDYTHAIALIQTAAMAKLTDSGGLMATKIIRLPAGVNGKKETKKRMFPVKLITMDGPYWTPEILLKHINFELHDELVTWDKIVAGSLAPLAAKYRTQYLPRAPIAQAINGAIDPVLEWLYQENYILADSGGEWLDIRCPWGHTHTTGDESAGYKALGRGDNPYMRGFNCFHEHCADQHTKEFIQYVLSNSDFGAIPIKDPSAGLFERYCFDETNNRVWRLSGELPTSGDINGFRTKFNQPVTAFRLGPKGITTRFMTVAQLWLESPYRQDVHGVVRRPGEGFFIKNEKHDTVHINAYRSPPWGDGKFSVKRVKKFEAYIEYLIPNDQERLYFLDWLSAKIQNPLFRGTGIVMVTPTFGTGRNTLGNMISELVGTYNAATVSFDNLLGATKYNYWEAAQIVIVSEAKESAEFMMSKGPHRAYETLKQQIDTTNYTVIVNFKYGPQETVNVCASYLIFTNHADAIAIPPDDRRLTVISNPLIPKNSTYFTQLNKWLRVTDENGDPAWAKHAYRWLRSRTIVDPDRLMLPFYSDSKQRMIDESRSLPARVCQSVALHLISNDIFAITQQQFRTVLNTVLLGLNYDREHRDLFYRNCFNDVSWGTGFNVRVDTKVHKVRLFKQITSACDVLPEHLKMTNSDLPKYLKDFIMRSIDAIDTTKIAKAVVDNIPT